MVHHSLERAENMTDDDELRELTQDDRCRFLDPSQPVDYRQVASTPSSYHCANCHRSSVKLWMDRNPTLPFLELCCIACIAARARINLEYLFVQANGQFWGAVWGQDDWTYETPGFVPAIPLPSNDTFYRWAPGYRPPADAWNWWTQLRVW